MRFFSFVEQDAVRDCSRHQRRHRLHRVPGARHTLLRSIDQQDSEPMNRRPSGERERRRIGRRDKEQIMAYIYTGKTALITGASSGIGAEFARVLAGRGMNVVLVARSEGRLTALAENLHARHGVRAEVVAADLSRAGAAAALHAETEKRSRQIDMLVNNAGFGTYGPFETLDAGRDHEEVMLNVAAVVDLCHAYLPVMAQRGEGAVLNVASTAGFQPTPYMAVYGATKAFVLSFSEALWAEYRGRGVRVSALCPGPTTTPFFDVVGSEEGTVGVRRTVAQAVATGLRAVEASRPSAVDGLANTLLAQTARFTPRAVMALLSRQTLRPHPPR